MVASRDILWVGIPYANIPANQADTNTPGAYPKCSDIDSRFIDMWEWADTTGFDVLSANIGFQFAIYTPGEEELIEINYIRMGFNAGFTNWATPVGYMVTHGWDTNASPYAQTIAVRLGTMGSS